MTLNSSDSSYIKGARLKNSTINEKIKDWSSLTSLGPDKLQPKAGVKTDLETTDPSCRKTGIIHEPNAMKDQSGFKSILLLLASE